MYNEYIILFTLLIACNKLTPKYDVNIQTNSNFKPSLKYILSFHLLSMKP